MFELNVFFIFAYIFSQEFSDQILTVEPTAECFCFHMFPTSFDSDKFGWFGGAGVLSFMVDPGDFFEHVDGEFSMKVRISGLIAIVC